MQSQKPASQGRLQNKVNLSGKRVSTVNHQAGQREEFFVIYILASIIQPKP